MGGCEGAGGAAGALRQRGGGSVAAAAAAAAILRSEAGGRRAAYDTPSRTPDPAHLPAPPTSRMHAHPLMLSRRCATLGGWVSRSTRPTCATCTKSTRVRRQQHLAQPGPAAALTWRCAALRSWLLAYCWSACPQAGRGGGGVPGAVQHVPTSCLPPAACLHLPPADYYVRPTLFGIADSRSMFVSFEGRINAKSPKFEVRGVRV